MRRLFLSSQPEVPAGVRRATPLEVEAAARFLSAFRYSDMRMVGARALARSVLRRVSRALSGSCRGGDCLRSSPWAASASSTPGPLLRPRPHPPPPPPPPLRCAFDPNLLHPIDCPRLPVMAHPWFLEEHQSS